MPGEAPFVDWKPSSMWSARHGGSQDGWEPAMRAELWISSKKRPCQVRFLKHLKLNLLAFFFKGLSGTPHSSKKLMGKNRSIMTFFKGNCTRYPGIGRLCRFGPFTNDRPWRSRRFHPGFSGCFLADTNSKFAPENQCLEDEFPFGAKRPMFSGKLLVSGSVVLVLLGLCNWKINACLRVFFL